jgi:hypothetical protein
VTPVYVSGSERREASGPSRPALCLRRDREYRRDYECEGLALPAAFDLAELLPLLAGERALALQTLELEFFSRPMDLLEALEPSPLTPKLRALDLTAESFTLAFVAGLHRVHDRHCLASSSSSPDDP